MRMQFHGSKTAAPFILLLLPKFMDAAPSSCEALSKLTLPDTSITLAQAVPAGEFTLPADLRPDQLNAPGVRPAAGVLMKLPSFCRVAATLKPTPDSDIKLEIWMPETNWNGKYEAVGNGGWAGSITYANMAEALINGYATSGTDTGHIGGSGSFALGHPEKLIDFAWRSEHEMTIKAKAAIKAYYGNDPKFSYWVGCSSGGKQGLKEAQKFPDDYDGIVAGAPVLNWTHRSIEALWVALGRIERSGQLHPGGKISPDSPGGRRRLRRA